MGLVVGGASGCSSSAHPGSSTSGSGGAPTCEQGYPLDDGTCLSVGVPADHCDKGFSADGKQGCEPILPPGDCPAGTMAVLGNTACQPVGVPADGCGAGFRTDGTGGCTPVLASADCVIGTMPSLGSTECQRVGVPPEQCGMGFTSDEKGGCEPVLPAADCPAGTMASPGDTACHEPQSCGSGTWGDIPVDAATQFVDASFAGGDSDGSPSHPWTTILEGLAHAAVGAVVAVAAGNYPENLVLDRGVKLWGVCPSAVDVTGGAADTETVRVTALSAGQSVEVHGLGITGPAGGMRVRGAKNVTLSGARVHDTGGTYGIRVENAGSASTPASLALDSTLIEAAQGRGVYALGSTLTLQSTVIRGTLPLASDGTHGFGIDLERYGGTRGSLTMSGSLLDQNRFASVLVFGSDCAMDRSVIRGTRPQSSNMAAGYGISVQDDASERGKLTLTSSLVERNTAVGLFVLGADATVRGTVVRDTKPSATNMQLGRGVDVQNDGDARGQLTLADSLVERNHSEGLFVDTSDATVQGTILRNTLPQASNSTSGRGVMVKGSDERRGTVSLSASLIENNDAEGMLVLGSDATVDGSVVRTTSSQVSDMKSGAGINVQLAGGRRGQLVLRSSLVDQNRHAGVLVFAADATIENTVVRRTLAQALDQASGVGVALLPANGQRAMVTMNSSFLDQNQAVSLIVTGSDAVVQNTVIANTQPDPSGMMFGYGIEVNGDGDERGALTLSSSLLDQNRSVGLSVIGAEATVENSILRATQAQASDLTAGRGIEVVAAGSTRSKLTMTSSLLDANHDVGLAVFGSDATVQGSLVRDTQPEQAHMSSGIGVYARSVDVQRGAVFLSSTQLDRNHKTGLFTIGSDATVQGCLIRRTQPQSSDRTLGEGIAIQNLQDQRGALVLLASLLDENHDVGLVVAGAQATVQDTVIRNTQSQASDGLRGHGVNLQDDEGRRGALTMTTSLLDQNRGIGLYSLGSDVTLDSTLVQNTLPWESDQSNGDGLNATLSQVTAEGSVFRGNARAAVSGFGSQLTLRRDEAICSPILFDQEIQSTDGYTGQPIAPVDTTFVPDRIACVSCDGVTLSCKAVSNHLSPPRPVPPLATVEPSQTPP